LNDVLPAAVPRLDMSGGNWVIFLLCFQMVIQGKGLWGHFNGTTTATPATGPDPTPPAPPTPTTLTTPPITQEMVDTWERDESIAHSLLAQCLPDSTLIIVAPYDTVKLMWDVIVREYMYKSAFSQAQLCCEFMTSWCPDKGNVWAFLGKLHARKAELV
ncbi:hypothetical protein P691DRAFT_627431, partial [Macrolepiota fuliginosa MF-IS2]